MTNQNIEGWGSSEANRKKAYSYFFGTLPWEEAKTSLSLQIGESDYTGAGKEPTTCTIVRCAKRSYGTSMAIVCAGVCYIDMVDGKGERVVRRFLLGKEARQVVKDNDAGKIMHPTEIVLLAPGKSQTVKARREAARKRRLDPKYAQQDRDRRNKNRKRLGRKKPLIHSLRMEHIKKAVGIMRII
jgi:hypothetical protein